MSTSWEEMIADLRIWKRENETAVNKPLLVLFILAQALHGGPNRFYFKDLVEPLESTLRAFGPERKVIHPEYAFWRLQKDGFWVVNDSDQFDLPGNRTEPTKKELLEQEAFATVPGAMWDTLRSDSALIGKLVNDLLQTHWHEKSMHLQILKAFGLEKARRIHHSQTENLPKKSGSS